MTEIDHLPILKGRRALIVGVANADSIAYGCAKAFDRLGAQLAITYLNDKAKPHVAPLAAEFAGSLLLPLDVEVPGQLEAVFAQLSSSWGHLDILVHSIAFAPKEDLKGGLLDCSAAGFSKAMDISCHSLIRMAKLARAAHDGRRLDLRDELLRLVSRRSELQRDGAGQGGARGVLPLSRL